MLTLIKLGGSLITDKTVEFSFRQSVVRRLAAEIKTSLEQNPRLQPVIGHGSGSFGHFAAQRYGTAKAVRTTDDWRGFAHVANVASQLNNLVSQALVHAGLPIWRIQPAASAICHDGAITDMALAPIKEAVNQGIIPLLHGDVALDDIRGGTIISTETILTYLAHHLPVERILLLGEVRGVLDTHGQVIAEITGKNLPGIAPLLGAAAGTDVTGGMATKVHDMLQLAQSVPGLHIHILNGTQPDLLQQVLSGEIEGTGTTIRA